MTIHGLLEHNIELLRAHGIATERSREPWLYRVEGHGELTERQVLDLAYRVTHTPQR